MSKYDQYFLPIAQDAGNIENLLDAFFSFLERKSDFFHIMTAPSDAKGFPTGRAFEILETTFKKRQHSYLSRVQPNLLSLGQNQPEKHKKAVKEPPCSEKPSSNVKMECLTKSEHSQATNSVSAEHTERPPLRKTETYWWSQTLGEATVELVLPEAIQNVKENIKVKLERSRINVMYRDAVLLEGEFYEPIQLDGSMWVVEDQSRLIVTLEKGRENWWGSILKGEKEIDLTKVESVKKIAEFDEETQAAIHKVMWDQEQKAQGLRTSEEMKTDELLKKAWEADSSPFKGQPFDPSAFNISGSLYGQ
ncbi:nudC domain-containing protein 3-like [Condylostylus longicornis]|uniref:nudC domain-containing protein 3-like n=1 Tax=Condylostylus longicornis TaxID=2530218 RepID=UPI00244E5108|nr:nudC domain-containing protein 3-like [Condylostylus longicornis]